MADSSSDADFERRVAALSGDLVEVVRTHIVRGVPVDAVLEALAAVLGTTIAGTVSSVDELERTLEIAALRIQQSSDDAFVQGPSTKL
ncbi:MAG: hypothetical protein Q7J32_03090 [Sphingomonadaceae bacterium]|nr:hypothetical protein [Sphingomonadaceae bacterium]